MEIIAKDPEKITKEDVQFLRENYTSSGGLLPNAFSGGAFFTPPHVAKFIWQILEDRVPSSPRILEPSVGSGVFLEHAPEDSEVTALELDETSAKVTSILYPETNVIIGDALTHDKRDYYDVVIGNPPYGVSCEFDDTGEEWRSLSAPKKGKRKGKSEVAFIELAIKAAKPGGYVAFVLPKGISFANYASKLREYMHETCWQVATIMLPGETFAHVGTTVETQIMIIRKATPNAEMVNTVEPKWPSSRGSGYGDMDEMNWSFLAGQTPAYFAAVIDIGYDKHGEKTDKWGDGLTQLDELIEDFTDGGLMRENLYPNVPSWYGLKDERHFFFSHGNDTCDGYQQSKMMNSDGPYRWQELTIGAGRELECPVLGYEVSSWDFDWQDEIVAKYYEEEE